MKITSFTKTILTLIVAGTFNIYQTKCQNVNAPGGLSNGYIPYAGVTNPAGIYNISDSPLFVNSGNIGIGTVSPGTYRLYVSGNTYSYGTITAFSSISGTNITASGTLSAASLSSTGAITGATTISASGLITSTGHNNNNGGITNTGAITGASNITASGTMSAATITASGVITSAGHNNNNGGITNIGAITGATNITGTGNFGIGNNATGPLSRISVNGNGNALYAGYIYNPNNVDNGATGLRVEGNNSLTGNNVYGIIGTVVGTGQGSIFGNVGVAYNATPQTSGQAFGVYGYAGNATSGYNYGVWGRGLGSNNACGVLGTDNASTQPALDKQYAGYFVGNLRTTDATPEKPTDAFWTIVSDKRTKKDVTDFNDGLNVIRKIRPVNFVYNGVGGLPSDTKNIGVIAQDVQKAAPYCIGKTRIVIKTSENKDFANDIIATIKNTKKDSVPEKQIAEVLDFNPNGLFFAMINSIRELDSTITAMKSQMGKRTGNPEEQGKSAATLQVDLANNNQTILYQNEPNPFDGSTVIRYFIPENVTGNALVVFCDMYGKEVNKLEIKEKGFGKIEANTENLANGIYSYSIIVDGKSIDTKKMLKTR